MCRRSYFVQVWSGKCRKTGSTSWPSSTVKSFSTANSRFVDLKQWYYILEGIATCRLHRMTTKKVWRVWPMAVEKNATPAAQQALLQYSFGTFCEEDLLPPFWEVLMFYDNVQCAYYTVHRPTRLYLLYTVCTVGATPLARRRQKMRFLESI
jgi:hypothetical protein